MSAINFLYKAILKRSSTYYLAIVVTTFGFERTVDLLGDKYFESHNHGKLWKHIKHNYEQ